MKNLLLFFLFFSINNLFGQTTDIDSLINLIDKTDGKDKILLLSDISYYSSFSNTELAEKYGRECVFEASKLNDSLLLAEAYNALAIALYAKSDYAEALKYNQLTLEIRLKKGDSYSLVSSYSKIGNCYHEIGKFDEAITYYIKSLEICETNNFVQQIGLISNNIAEVFKSQNKLDKAREYYAKSIEIANSLKDTIGLCKALINLGVSYERDKQLNLADSSFNIAYDLIKGKNMLDIEGGLLINYGVLHKEWGHIKQSIDYYQKARKIYDISGEIHGLAIVYTNLGNSFLELNQFDSAYLYFSKGVELTKETHSLSRLLIAYEGLSHYYRLTNNYRTAFTYDSLANICRDSIYSIENTKIIEELNTKYETGKKEKQLAEQEAEIAKQQVKAQIRNNQLLIALGGIILLVFITIVIYRNQKNKQEKLQQQVALEKVLSVTQIQDEKLRISRDLHDNIGSQLTYIISSLDNLNFIDNVDLRNKKLNQLSNFTRETMSQLRETIWAMKSESITIEELTLKVKEFIHKVSDAFPEISFKAETIQSKKTLNATEAINIFRTIQEAINNAIKHSNAKNISFKPTENSLSVLDDGIGFERHRITNGYGLSNMESRMQEVGMSAIIQSHKNKGTEVMILLN